MRTTVSAGGVGAVFVGGCGGRMGPVEGTAERVASDSKGRTLLRDQA